MNENQLLTPFMNDSKFGILFIALETYSNHIRQYPFRIVFRHSQVDTGK